MRGLLTLMLTLTFVVLAAAAQATEAPRAPGVYASLTVANAEVCARACADDGICMAWRLQQENRCQLSAVVPSQADLEALASGYASRAPTNLQPPTPVLHAAPDIEPQTATAPEAPAPGAALQASRQDDGVLLGGPEEGELRLR
jgi:hypothetical protein